MERTFEYGLQTFYTGGLKKTGGTRKGGEEGWKEAGEGKTAEDWGGCGMHYVTNEPTF